jgi:hypothetical protein
VTAKEKDWVAGVPEAGTELVRAMVAGTVNAQLGLALIEVTSDAVAVAEPPPDTLTWLVRVAGALAATLTVTVIG